MSTHRTPGRRSFASVGLARAGSAATSRAASAPDGSPPDWDAVEALVSELARTHAVFPTATARSTWISSYEPGRRLMVESEERSSWVQLAHVRTCWRAFEERGRICRRDVLEPGRHSAFMIGLFAQLRGVRHDERDERYLILDRSSARGARTAAR